MAKLKAFVAEKTERLGKNYLLHNLDSGCIKTPEYIGWKHLCVKILWKTKQLICIDH